MAARDDQAGPEPVRLVVRVRPGASRAKVGGRYGDGELVVAVTQRAVDGKATEACLRAVAGALGVRRSVVHLVTGQTRRSKVVEIDVADRVRADVLRAAVTELLDS
ncbi:MAG: DUF167 domain-containing protein [Kineosporiaceae bacterium]|jgi:uncharacterized protein